MAIRGLKELYVGQIVGGQSSRQSFTSSSNETHFLELINLRQVEKGVWETRGGFTELTSLVSPTGDPYIAQFDYQHKNGTRAHLGVVDKNLVRDGQIIYPSLSTTTRGRFLHWSLADVTYYFNGVDHIRFDGVTARTAGLTAPTTASPGTASGSGSLTAGNYRIRVTFVSDVKESSPGPQTTSAVASGGSDTIVWTSIPTGPAGTISRNIYRTAAGGSVFYYDFTISDNTTTTGTSSQADSSLGEELRLNQDNPPTFTGAEIFNDHVFFWGNSSNPDTIYISRPGEPETVEPDDFIDFSGKKGDVSGGIIKAVSYRGKLFVFRHDTIHFLQGNNRDDFVTSVNSINYGPVGAIAQDSFQVIEGLLYFLAEDGPYVFDGASQPRYIGGENPSIWDPYHVHGQLNQEQLKNVQSVYYRPKKQWWIAVPEKNQNVLSAVFVYHPYYQTRSPDIGPFIGQWSKYESSLFPVSNISIVEGTTGDLTDIDRVILADKDGNLYEHDTSTTDDGTSITWTLLTKAIHFDTPFVDKTWMYFTPFISEIAWNSATIRIKFYFDQLGNEEKVYIWDFSSERDASALWGQMLWNSDIGHWAIRNKVITDPILIKRTGKTLNVLMRGLTPIKIHGFHVSAVQRHVRDSLGKGTIRAQPNY